MIRHILFDLDNTIYPASGLMDKNITRRMLQFIADFLSLSYDDAAALQRERRKNYGTTLEWLETEYHFTDRKHYFEAVHPPSEIAELTPDPHLRPFLQSLALPVSILTNAPMAHAIRVLDFFNIRDIFTGIFDITYHDGKGKPDQICFRRTLEAIGTTVQETLFLDDCPAYINGYVHFGGTAVLVDETNQYQDTCIGERIYHVRSIYELPTILTHISQK